MKRERTTGSKTGRESESKAGNKSGKMAVDKRTLKIKIGDTYKFDRTTLTVTDIHVADSENNDNMICKCSYCNRLSVYSKLDWVNKAIAGCSLCIGESKKDTEAFNKLSLKHNQKIGSTQLKKLVKCYNRIDAVLECSECKKQTSVSLTNIYNQLQDYTKKQKIKQINSENIEELLSMINICECQKMNELKEQVGLIHAVKEQDIPKFRPKATRQFENWLYLRGEVVGTKQTLQVYQCQKCFAIKKLREKEMLTFDGVCNHCEELKESHSIPLTQMDWIGYTSNCRKIKRVYIEDNIKMCEVECMVCGKTESLALSTMITDNSLLCDNCASKKIQLVCPICNQPHIKTTLRALYSNSVNATKMRCDVKNQDIERDDLLYEHEFKVEMKNIKDMYRKKYTFNHRIKGDENRASLIVFNEGYEGTDGNFYNTCMCPKHNKFLNLNENEVGIYNHEYCIDMRMVAYNSKGKVK